MKFGKRYLVVMALLAVLLVVPQSLMAAPVSPFLDMKTDVNQDGVPDALATAMDNVANAKDTDAAIAALVRQLPYSRETRLLQMRAAELQGSIEMAKSEAEIVAINAELAKISDELMADPVYVKTMDSLAQMYVEKGIFPAAKETSGVQIMVSWGSMQPGDVMLIRSGWLPWTAFIYGMWYGHAGNYHGNGLVYESNADGVRFKPLSNWQSSGQYIALGRSNRRSISEVAAALTWAEGYYGTDGRTPYNFWYPDKNTNARLYCSQLTWKIHQRTGVDVDSNAWQYHLWIGAKWGLWAIPAVAVPAVAPDEVGLDGDINFYSKGWN